MSPTKMWVLVSCGAIIGEPAKSEAAMAQRLGLSRQYLNKQLKKGKNLFMFKGMPVSVRRRMEFAAAGREFVTKKQMADALGLSPAAVDRVFKNGTTGIVKNKDGKDVTISQVAGSTIPTCPRPIPAIRVISDIGGPQEFPSIAAASRELKIDPKTISNALRSGRDSFTRKSDGEKFTVEIPGEKRPPHVVYKEELVKLAGSWAQAWSEGRMEDADEASEKMNELKVSPRAKPRFPGKPKDAMEKYLNETRVIEREEHMAEEAEKLAVWVEKANAVSHGVEQMLPVPAPRKKEKKVPPVPAPRVKRQEEKTPPVPAPRKKQQEEKVPPVPAPRTKRQEEPEEPDQLERARIQMYNDLKREEIEKYRHRDVNWLNMMCKYPGWLLDKDVDVEFEETMMLLFHPDSGVDIQVKDNADIAKYFSSRNYLYFPDQAEFDNTIMNGRWNFEATTSGYEEEEWVRLIFIWGE